MVHKMKRQDKYIVTALYGTPLSPEVESYLIEKSEVRKKVAELKGKPRVKQITVERGGLVDYLRGFTVFGEIQTISRMRKDIPSRTEVVILSKPKDFFTMPRVRRVIR